MKIPGLVISTVVNVYGTDDVFTFIATCVACTLLPLDGFLDALIYGADELRLLKLCRWIRRKMCLGSSKGYKKKRLGEMDGMRTMPTYAAAIQRALLKVRLSILKIE